MPPRAATRALRSYRGAELGHCLAGHSARAALPVAAAVSASYVTCGSLDHFLMVSSGMPAASSTLPKTSSAGARANQFIRSARPSNGEAEACTWSGRGQWPWEVWSGRGQWPWEVGLGLRLRLGLGLGLGQDLVLLFFLPNLLERCEA